jgi:hypothetical protein
MTSGSPAAGHLLNFRDGVAVLYGTAWAFAAPIHRRDGDFRYAFGQSDSRTDYRDG